LVRNLWPRRAAGAPAGLTAAAAIVSVPKLKAGGGSSRAGGSGSEGWRYLRRTGELGDLVRWRAQSLSRCPLELYRQSADDDAEDEPVTEGPLYEAVRDMWPTDSDQAAMLARWSVLRDVPGEGWLVGYPDKEAPGGVTYTLASTAEIDTAGKLPILRTMDVEVPLKEDSFVARVWNPDPEVSSRAFSPTIPLLPVLKEMEELEKYIFARIDSRLAGNGILFLPQEFSLPKATTDGLHEDPYMASLIEGMTTPIRDRSVASAVVPLVSRGPGEQIKNILRMQFGETLDPQAIPQRDACIRRIALGFDTAPERLTGMSQGSHWTAWKVTEDDVIYRIVPAVENFGHNIRKVFLGPLAKKLGVEDWRSYYFRVDPTALLLRPDRGEDVTLAYDRGEADGDALREARGIPDSAKPSHDERRQRILIELAKASPELAAPFLHLAGVLDESEARALLALMPGAALAPAPLRVAAQPEEIQETTEDAPERPTTAPVPDSTPPALAASISVASARAHTARVVGDLAVRRALEIAGKRALPRTRDAAKYADSPAWELHTRHPVATDQLDRVLSGVWTFLDGTASAPLVASLDRYVRMLLVSGRRHDATMLGRVVDSALAGEPDGSAA